MSEIDLTKKIKEDILSLPKTIKYLKKYNIGTIITELIDNGIDVQHIDQIILVGSGSSKSSAVYGRYLIEEFTHIPCEVYDPSDYNYYSLIKARKLLIAISESGKTSHVLDIVRLAKHFNVKIIGITKKIKNEDNFLERMSDQVFFIHDGSIDKNDVFSISGYVNTLIIFWIIVMSFCKIKGLQNPLQNKSLTNKINELSVLAKHLVDFDNYTFDEKKLKSIKSITTTGHDLNLGLAYEASQKIKEFANIDSAPQPLGELWHSSLELCSSSRVRGHA